MQAMGEIRAVAFVGVCGQGKRASGAEKFFQGVCSRDGRQVQLLSEKGFVPE